MADITSVDFSKNGGDGNGKRTVERTLKEAVRRGLKEICILGYDEDGEFVFLSSSMLRKDALWFCELGRDHVLNGSNDAS